MPLVLDGTNGVSGVDGTASNPAIEGTDSNTGIFYPAADTVAIGTGGTERLRVDSAGNAGLGVTPSAWSGVGAALQVGTSAAIIGNSANSSSFISNAYFDGTNYRYIGTGFATRFATTSGAYSWNQAASGTAGNTITFTQAMTLDASGNLGIGTSSPSFATGMGIAINGGAGQARLVLKNNNTGDASTDGLQIGVATDSSAFVEQRENSHLFFATNAIERARVTSGGDFLVGTTTAGAGASKVYIYGDGTNPAFKSLANTSTTTVYAGVFRHESTTAGAYIQFVTDGNVETGRIYDLAGTMQYASSSDARLKTNVQPMQNSLQSVLALNPCTFDMRRGEDTFIPSAGLIAQEVHEVYPYVVGVGGDDENTNPWSVDYGKLTPLLVAAIKELNAKVEAQAAEIAALKGNA